MKKDEGLTVQIVCVSNLWSLQRLKKIELI